MAATLKTCSVPGCKRLYRAKGLCATHYARLAKNGSPYVVQRNPMIAGERHGRLVAISFVESRNGKAHWQFQCDCGRQIIVNATNVRRGATASCGCWKIESQKYIPRNITHGMSNTPTWKSWRAMRDRCTREAHTKYANYGGRGITICARWDSFELFLADMGPRPLGMTLDRHPNKDGNYEPGNVRWATDKDQNRNKRTTRMVPFHGHLMPLSQAVELAGLNLKTIKGRLRNGWSAERALSEPIDKRFSRPQK